jgi:hypothetical protein
MKYVLTIPIQYGAVYFAQDKITLEKHFKTKNFNFRLAIFGTSNKCHSMSKLKIAES